MPPASAFSVFAAAHALSGFDAGQKGKMCKEDEYNHKHPLSSQECQDWCAADTKCSFVTWWGMDDTLWKHDKDNGNVTANYCAKATNCAYDIAQPQAITFKKAGARASTTTAPVVPPSVLRPSDHQVPPPWAAFVWSTDYAQKSKLFRKGKDGFLDYIGKNDAADCPLNIKFECQIEKSELQHCDSWTPEQLELKPNIPVEGCLCGSHSHKDDYNFTVCAWGQACNKETNKCHDAAYSGQVADAPHERHFPHDTHKKKSGRPRCISDYSNPGEACGWTANFREVHNFTDFYNGSEAVNVKVEEDPGLAEWKSLWDAFPVNEFGEKTLTDEEYHMMSTHGSNPCSNPGARGPDGRLAPMKRSQILERAAGWLGMGVVYGSSGWVQGSCALETCGSEDDPNDCPRYSYMAVCQSYKDMAWRGSSSMFSSTRNLTVGNDPCNGCHKVCKPGDAIARKGHTQLFRRFHVIAGMKYVEVWQMGGGPGKVNRKIQVWTPETHSVGCYNRNIDGDLIEDVKMDSEDDYTIVHDDEHALARWLDLPIQHLHRVLEVRDGEVPMAHQPARAVVV